MNVYIDIETIPNQSPGSLAEHKQNVKAPGQYKKPESIKKWLADNAASVGEQSWLRTSLNGNEGEIVVICFACGNEDVQSVHRLPDQSEREMLISFNQMITKSLSGKQHINTPYFIGHNVRHFDLPFLFKRMVINDVQPSFLLKVYGRHGNDCYDTMEAWEGFNGNIKLDLLAKILGIGSKKEGMDGSQVWPEIKAGNISKVIDYCKDDVRLVRDVFNRLNFLHSNKLVGEDAE